MNKLKENKYNAEGESRSKDIYILGIETSCDDTCASVVKNGNVVLSNIIASQDEIHRKYGGVVPEVASRKHIEIIDIIIGEAIEKSGLAVESINAVSVTNRPGLIGSLLVGVGAAKAICYATKIPLIAVNHLEAHIYSNILKHPEITGSFIALVVSGGHSSLYLVDRDSSIEEIGHTVDDAVGEAFDKISRYLGLGYPGGPVIDKLSRQGNPDIIKLPRPMIDSGDFNFSFSGLKTALIYRTKRDSKLLAEENIPNLAASFQESATDVLVEKTIMACSKYGLKKILVCGGVAANTRLREKFRTKGNENNISVYIPLLSLCMDNAAMVACLGYYKYLKGIFSNLDVDVYSRSNL